MARPLPTDAPRFTVYDTPVLRTVLRWMGVAFLKVTRWQTRVELPEEPTWLAIVAPHTSFWDFPIMLSMAFKHRIRANWLGKHTLFRGPGRPFFRWLGGIPVDPGDSGNGRVEQVIDIIGAAGEMRLGIAPEAGLSPTTRWRTGFYHIAVGAGIPLVLGFLDHRTRVAGADEWFHPSGDMAADFERIRSFYRPMEGRYPERFLLPEIDD